MKRIIAIGVLFSYIPIYVAPLWGLNNQLTIKTKLNKTQYKTYTDYKIDIEKITENATELTTELVEETTETTTEETYIKGFVTTKVNIRENNSINSSVISQLNFNEEIEYYIYDANWSKIKYNNLTGYIKSDYITKNKIQFKTKTVPQNNFKSYMPYQAITSKTSPQYKLQHKYAYTGNYGIRQVDGRYCIAVGSAYATNIGTYIDLILENNVVIPCILSDQKADQHTNSNNTITVHDGSLAEFIVDIKALSKQIKIHGDVSFACTEWNTSIKTIKIYEKNILKGGE